MIIDEINKKISDIESIAKNNTGSLEFRVHDLTDGILMVADVVDSIQETLDEKITVVNNEITEVKEEIKKIKTIKGDKGDKGLDGLDGLDGKDGKNGIDGLDGKDGSPDTPEQIIEKINTLENVIDIKTIKDFPVIESTSDIKRQVDTIGNQVLRLLSKRSETQQVDLSGYVPIDRTITINGVSHDLSEDRSWVTPSIGSVGITIDGQGGVITTGFKGSITIPFSGTITGWQIIETSSTPITSNIVIDVWKDSYANYPATVSDSIFTTKPTLSSAIKNQNLSPTFIGSGDTITAGDTIGFNVDSVTSALRINLILFINKLS